MIPNEIQIRKGYKLKSKDGTPQDFIKDFLTMVINVTKDSNIKTLKRIEITPTEIIVEGFT